MPRRMGHRGGRRLPMRRRFSWLRGGGCLLPIMSSSSNEPAARVEMQPTCGLLGGKKVWPACFEKSVRSKKHRPPHGTRFLSPNSPLGSEGGNNSAGGSYLNRSFPSGFWIAVHTMDGTTIKYGTKNNNLPRAMYSTRRSIIYCYPERPCPAIHPPSRTPTRRE